MSNVERPPRWRVWLAVGFLLASGVSFLAGAAMVASTLSLWLKGLGTTLVFPARELFTMVAVTILGKAGYDYLKGLVIGYLKRYGPPQTVGRARHTIGLVLFPAAVILPWLAHYFGSWIPGFDIAGTWFYVVCDLVFLSSLFVLGGDLWDKIRSLILP